jgi:hypothetical protein
MKLKFKKWFLILAGSIIWSWTMVKSGWFYPSLGKNGPGLGFWGANGHDGIVHIALSESLSRGTFSMPFFAGSLIQNYHIGFDLILAFLHDVTFIPTLNLYFQIFPPILAVLTGILTYKFVFNWTKSEKSAFWATFFTYFGGSFGWILGKGESAFWSQQAISSLINPPFALSVILLLVGLVLLTKLEQKFTFLNFILGILVFGSLIEIKAYAGILSLGALFVAGLYSLIVHKKSVFLKIFVGSLILSLVLYLPLNRNSPGLLVFQPFWYLETMMGLVDRLNWIKFYSAMLTYRSGHIWLKALVAYGVAFVIFILGNFGTRIIFLFKKIKIDELNIFIYSVIGAGIVIPMFFLQKGTPWNTIQFFYYSLFLSAILAGITIGYFLENSKLSTSILYSIEVVIILITVPTTFLTLNEVYVPSRPPAMISSEELSALSFLSKEPAGVVLTEPFDQAKANAAIDNPPRPLYLYTSTAYVSALSKHQTFLEDEINLDISGYNWQPRRSEVLAWYGEEDNTAKRQFLKNNNIKYIYWIKNGQSPLDLGKLGLANIYENNLVTIYQVE